MGNDDGAASVCGGDSDADSSCQFLKCVVPKDKQPPVYLEVSEACGFATQDDSFLQDGDAVAVVVEEMGRMSAKQDESGNWIVQWNVRRQQEGDFIGLYFVGKLFFYLNKKDSEEEKCVYMY